MREVGSFEGNEVGLENVVTIRMCRKFEDEMVELGSDFQKFVVERCRVLANDFDEGLDRSCPMDIHGDVDD